MYPYAVKWAITPLRMIFWGGLLCIFDFTFSQTVNGRGFKFDVLNDALGMLLIAVGVFRLGAIPVSRRYASVMSFVQVVSVLAVLDAVRAHFIFPLPLAFSVGLQLFGFITLVAVIAFCVAMRWFCEEARLSHAAQSWRVTTLLFVTIYLLPLGPFYLISAGAIASDTPFNINLGPAGLLLVPVFAIPVIHLFVSTSRMERGAETMTIVDSEELEPVPTLHPPPRPRGSPLTLLLAVLLAVAAVVVFVIFVPEFHEELSKTRSPVKVGSSGSVNIEDALAIETTGQFFRHYFVEGQYGVANGEYAFLVIAALQPEESGGGGSGSSSSGQFRGHWNISSGGQIAFQCTIATADTDAGVMQIGNSKWRLAGGRVFLIKPAGGGPPEVQQVKAPLVGDSPKEVVKNLVKDSDDVRAFLVAELSEGLRSDKANRRADAAFLLYRCGLAADLKTPLLVKLLEDDQSWVRFMAAKALWDRQRHEAALPALVALLQETGYGGGVRRQVVRVLCEIGPQAKAAVPALREALKSNDNAVRSAAAEVLKKIDK